ncbi:MAG TPA: DUF1573 domain-containing protein [Gemmataceae bacterium]
MRVLLGLVLLTAAGLKLYGLNVTALPRVGWFATPQVQLVVAEWELVLGLWLLSGAAPAGAWLAAVGTFLAFAAVSGYFGWIGVASCGCLGVIRASPWTAFGVDVAALLLLAATRPSFRTTSLRVSFRPAVIPLGAAVILVFLTGIGAVLYGSPAAALARLRGDTITVSTDYLDFGAVSAGKVVERSVDVQNWTDRPVRLIGGTSDCSCVTTSDLPLTVPPGEARAVTIRMKAPPTKPGAVTRVAELWTDHPDRRTVRIRVGFLEVE